MRLGKLTNEQLNQMLLGKLGFRRPDVVMRSGIGVDCGAITFGNEICVISTDPITAVSEGGGALCVQVGANDVAASGAEPIAMLLTILAAPNTPLSEIEAAMSEASREAERQGIEIIGGHTEVTDAVTRMVLSATIVGRVLSDALVMPTGAQPGDDLILCGWAAMEGTAILAKERADVRKLLSAEELAAADGLSALLSVTSAARAAAPFANAMHDCTEGGVFGAAWEMSAACGCGLIVWREAVPVLPVTERICAILGMDAMRLIASGALLIAATKDETARIEAIFAERGFHFSVIGEFTQVGDAVWIKSEGEVSPLEPPEGDELFSAFTNEITSDSDA